MKEMLQKQGVFHSIGNAKRQAHHNQVQERFNRTLKDNVGLLAKDFLGLPERPKSLAFTKKVKDTQLKELISAALQRYNDSPHKHLGLNTRNQAETAIAMYAKPDELIPALARSGTADAITIQHMKNAALAHYGNNRAEFFVRWVLTAERQHQETLAKIEEVKAEVKKEADKVIQAHKQENHLLKIELEKLKESLSYVEARELEREAAEKEALERRTKREDRKRLPLMNAATSPEFDHAVKIVKNQYRISSFIKSFRISAKRIFLTYSQVNSKMSTYELLQLLQEKRQLKKKKTDYVIAKEIDQDRGGLSSNTRRVRFHAILTSKRKFKIRNQGALYIKFEEETFRGKYQAVNDLQEAVKYACKDGHYMSNLPNLVDGKLLEKLLLQQAHKVGAERALLEYTEKNPEESFSNCFISALAKNFF